MNKKYFTFLVVLIVALSSIYLLIPSSIQFSNQVKANEFDLIVFKMLCNNKIWNKEDSIHIRSTSGKPFYFQITKISFPQIFIKAVNKNLTAKAEIKITPNAKGDSCIIAWKLNVPTGFTPWSRLKTYFNGEKLSNAFTSKMKSLAQFMNKTENIYGLPIVKTMVKDTLIATLIQYQIIKPTDSLTCARITSLRWLISQSGWIIIDSAMINTQKQPGGNYKLMVGFPVNKAPANLPDFFIKKMIPGKLLTATVKGGHAAINLAFLQMQNYISDHDIEEAALPYEVMITNRCKEKDSLNWITKICYPVF